MDLRTLQNLQKIYKSGSNISQFLREQEHSASNTPEIIQIAYDLQAGSYIKYHTQTNPEFNTRWTDAIAQEIRKLTNNRSFSLLEAGVGEATTFSRVVSLLKKNVIHSYGFDISWSRLRYGLEYTKKLRVGKKTSLFLADLLSIPLADNSIDIVYTSHSIEPNGGKEKEILQELYRVTAKYLVLLEPSYTFGSKEARSRMKQHGFITRLPEAAKQLGYEVVTHRLFDLCSNPLNPTGLMIIKKKTTKTRFAFQCPISAQPLIPQRGVYFSPKGMLVYPVVDGIPCLLPQNALVATHFADFSYGK